MATAKEEVSTTEQQPNDDRPKVEKKKVKHLTGKRDDTVLHSAARDGNLDEVVSILHNNNSGDQEEELKELLSKQNIAGETPLYVAAENGRIEIVTQLLMNKKLYDPVVASIKARNGLDAFLIAAKQGDLEVLKALMETDPSLSMTYDSSNTTALQMAATQGHTEVVKFLLESGSGQLASISRSNGKTALHSAARNGHLEVVTALLGKEPGISVRVDKKGQTALLMAVKGQSIEIVDELIKADSSLVNLVDNKGNAPLHVAARKGREQIILRLLCQVDINKSVINRVGETAFDTAEKTNHPEIAAILTSHGVVSAKLVNPPATGTRELKQTVSDIKHEVHYQLEHTRQTRKRVQVIQKRLNKMHVSGLNNAINSTTVVAVLIATVAFAAIFTVPGQYADDPHHIPKGHSLGEANIAPKVAFLVFFVFDSVAMFISLAVVVVQTSVVVVESKAKKKMMAIINKLMWLACVMITVSFLALSFVVVGRREMWLAIGVAVIGATIMGTTIGVMGYWAVKHHLEARSRNHSIRKSSMESKSTVSVVSDSDFLPNEMHNKLYAL